MFIRIRDKRIRQGSDNTAQRGRVVESNLHNRPGFVSQGAQQTWRQPLCVGYKTIVKQRQIQCIVWDIGFKQILVCQTDICLEPKREKEAPGHHFHSLFPLQKCKIQFLSDISICLIPTPIYQVFKQTIYMFNFSRLFCNTSLLLSIVRRILV